MGYYIEVPNNKGKAQQIIKLHGGRIIPAPVPLDTLSDNEAIICVVDNGPFEAAGFAYSEKELDEFSRPDGRPRTWVIMDRAKACELTGFKED